MKTHSCISFLLGLLLSLVACKTSKIIYKSPCGLEFSYYDTVYADWGEEWHLKRTYITKNIFIDSTTYADINLTGVYIDTFKIENNEWFYLHMGTYYLLFSEEKFKKGEISKYFSRKDSNPVIDGTIIYRPKQFYLNYTPSRIINHSYLGLCYVFWVEENRELGTTSPSEVYFSPIYGLVGFGSTIVTKIKNIDCK